MAALDQARSGTGQFLLISGEAGIGKSAVLSFLADMAKADMRILRGFCVAGSGVPPYWPWIQVLRGTGLGVADLGEAGRLLETTGGWAEPDGALAAADARFRLQDAIGRSLAVLAADRPVVVLLDDLHWADEQSIAVLPFLARASAADRMLIAGAYRDTEVSAASTASAALAGLAERGQHLPLRGLSLAEAETMVASLPGTSPSAELTAQVWRRGGGNPFFVRELTRLVQAQGTGQLPGHLPASVIETVRRRLARLSSDCVALLDWAAVVGRYIDVQLLVAAGAVSDETAALDLLAQARQAGVVAPDDPPRFTHDLFRDAILDGHAPTVTATLNLAIGRALQGRARPGDSARIAAHLLSAGPQARGDAVEYSIRAARQATARLGHHDACAHYLRALPLVEDGDPRQIGILLELAAAQDREGSADAARATYRRAAASARQTADTVGLARAALGLQALGHRSQASTAEVVELLRAADDALRSAGDRAALHSGVLAALTRALRHGADGGSPEQLVPIAERAVALAAASGDAAALATAKLALHDALWQPGSAAVRLPIAGEMLAAARRAGDPELIAVAHQLRATALLELGDPAGRDELLEYVGLAGELGHARGRWAGLTRRATYAQIAGRVDEATALAAEALELGRAIGEPDAEGCHDTLCASLVALGGESVPSLLDRADPMWPMFPILAAWGPAVRGDLATARNVLGDFSVLDLTTWTGLEALAVAAVVFSAVGSSEQRRWTYEALLPFAGTHVVVGGCASYHAAVDHHLGSLAASLGDRVAAETHLTQAIAMHHELGAAGWERISRRALDRVRQTDDLPNNEFRFNDGRWVLRFAGLTIFLPDAKGLHDLAALIAASGAEVRVRELLDPDAASAVIGTGADPVLDGRAKSSYRARIAELTGAIDEADGLGHTARAGRLADERDALIRELAAATGLTGRDRRLGDEAERARKTVGARVRASLAKIDTLHPQLAAHLRTSVRLGTSCSYSPAVATKWRLS